MTNVRSEPVAIAAAAENALMQVSTLQAELVALKAETAAKVASLEDTIANLAQALSGAGFCSVACSPG